MTDNAEHREEVASALEALAAFLREHADLPVPWRIRAVISPDGTDDERCAEVDLVARILGTEAGWNDRRTHYTATRDFGGGVELEAYSVWSGELESWRAHSASYKGPSRKVPGDG
jgi:hypothetical protein